MEESEHLELRSYKIPTITKNALSILNSILPNSAAKIPFTHRFSGYSFFHFFLRRLFRFSNTSH
ncbi:unnamed protein product [Sphenostylis stenocarpa]|uniref:Uncharacterized protein n=1 Tax=Sphenostylis stenocarpa TaxID=92480 RepID=A0AA86V4M5_9FABA|nr:unnamed protein product [Sphenostylis stenocarpa]